MLTKEQEKWINHLSADKKVEIFPYDPQAKKVFELAKKEILEFLPKAQIFHKGSTALGIAGQGEVDLYISVLEKEFDVYLQKLVSHFGKPGSVYALKRARFVKYYESVKTEIFLINKETIDWKNSEKFENYLLKNKKFLSEYEKLKIKSSGLSVQQYYRKKLEFINKILEMSGYHMIT